MDDLLLHQTTRQQLEGVVSGGTQAIVLVGSLGAGKGTVALSLAAKLLGLTDKTKMANHPYFLHLLPEAKDMTIDQIRQLQKFLTLKTTGRAAIRRVAVVEAADHMNTQAQNAILKTLEEPPADTVLILCAAELDLLLPTIRSRVQAIYIRPPAESDAVRFFGGQGYAEAEVKRIYAISGGSVALMHELLSNSQDNEFIGQINLAKTLLSKNIYDRLLSVEALSKDKEAVSGLLLALKRICISTLELVAAKQQTASVASWHTRLEVVLEAEEAHAKNANQKLLLTDLFVRL